MFSFAMSSEGDGIKAGVDCALLFLQARVEANSVKLTFTFEGKNLPSSLLCVLHSLSWLCILHCLSGDRAWRADPPWSSPVSARV